MADPENSGAASAAEQLQAELAGLDEAKKAAEARGNKEQLKAIDASIARREKLLKAQPKAAPAEEVAERAVAPADEAEQAVVEKPKRSRAKAKP